MNEQPPFPHEVAGCEALCIAPRNVIDEQLLGLALEVVVLGATSLGFLSLPVGLALWALRS